MLFSAINVQFPNNETIVAAISSVVNSVLAPTVAKYAKKRICNAALKTHTTRRAMSRSARSRCFASLTNCMRAMIDNEIDAEFCTIDNTMKGTPTAVSTQSGMCNRVAREVEELETNNAAPAQPVDRATAIAHNRATTNNRTKNPHLAQQGGRFLAQKMHAHQIPRFCQLGRSEQCHWLVAGPMAVRLEAPLSRVVATICRNPRR
jgi:hypothetical protein